MIDTLAIDVLLVTTFIDEHILVILPEKRKATVSDSKPDAMKKLGDTLANAVADGVETGKKTSKNIYIGQMLMPRRLGPVYNRRRLQTICG